MWKAVKSGLLLDMNAKFLKKLSINGNPISLIEKKKESVLLNHWTDKLLDIF